MTRGLLIALGGGLLGAVLFLSVRTGAPGAMLFALFASMPLFAVGLMQGLAGALVACAAATLATLAATGGFGGAMFVLRVAVPVLIVTRQALLSRPGAQPGAVEWYPPGLLLAWLTGYALAVLVGVSLWYAGREGGIEGVMRGYFEALAAHLVAEPADPRLRAFLDAAPRYLPGAMIAFWLLLTLLNAVLAQLMLERAGHARRPAPPFAALVLPRWLVGALAAALLCTLLPGQLGTFGRNAVVVSGLPYFLLGLATVHTLVRRLRSPGLGLAAFYVMFLLATGPLALFVMILGIIEQWFLLRRRYAAQGTNPEDE